MKLLFENDVLCDWRLVEVLHVIRDENVASFLDFLARRCRISIVMCLRKFDRIGIKIFD